MALSCSPSPWASCARLETCAAGTAGRVVVLLGGGGVEEPQAVATDANRSASQRVIRLLHHPTARRSAPQTSKRSDCRTTRPNLLHRRSTHTVSLSSGIPATC